MNTTLGGGVAAQRGVSDDDKARQECGPEALGEIHQLQKLYLSPGRGSRGGAVVLC